MCVLGAFGFITAGSSRIARADDPAPPPGPPTDAGYPQELAARPLLLPAGGLEGTVQLVTSREEWPSGELGGATMIDFVNLEPRARYALARLELEAGVGVLVFEDLSESQPFFQPERLQSVSLAARYGLTPDASVGVQLTAITPAGDYTSYQPALTVERKLHLSARAAIDVGARAGASWSSFSSGTTSSSSTSLLVAGQAGPEAQLSSRFALRAIGRLGYARVVDAPTGTSPAVLSFDVELGALVAITRDLDVIAGVDFQTSGDGDYDVKLFTVGLAGRRVP